MEDFLEIFLEIFLEPWLHNLYFTQRKDDYDHGRKNQDCQGELPGRNDPAGVGKTAATRWISRQTVRGVLIMRRYLACKDDMIRFLASPDFQDSPRLPKRAKELVARMVKPIIWL